MVVYDMQEFGGLEEYAVTLATALQQEGHPVSVLSTAWVAPDNQYLRRLREQQVQVIYLPRWLSHAASHWPTKEQILATTMRLLCPVVYLLGLALWVVRRSSWQAAKQSAYHWLRAQLMRRIIGPDRRQPLTRLLLRWWQLYWRPDLLHLHGYTTNLLFAIDWADRAGVPIVYEEHQTPDAQFDWWQGFHSTINKANVVVAVSEKSAEALAEICGVTQPIVVRSPLLPDPMANGWHKPARQQGVATSINLTTVARLAVAKGLTYLLDAIAEVTARYPNARFRVYGNGDQRQALLAHAAALGLDGNTIFVGAFTTRAELSAIMAETDIFVMSSVLEGQPLAVVEAMSYGCPIVTTAVGGIPEIIEDGRNGMLCAPKDPAALVEKITALIETPTLRTTLGTAARNLCGRPLSAGKSLSPFSGDLCQRDRAEN
ncbi:MAG: glycosyltransferase family 4 protein [Caldilineaceae bacterium]